MSDEPKRKRERKPKQKVQQPGCASVGPTPSDENADTPPPGQSVADSTPAGLLHSAEAADPLRAEMPQAEQADPFAGLFDPEPATPAGEVLPTPPDAPTTKPIAQAPRAALTKAYDVNTARELIEFVRSGATIKKACEQFNLSRKVLRAWAKARPEFAEEFERAKQDGIDHLAESALEQIANEQSPQRARVQLDAVKWLASVGNPAKYSEKLQMNVTHGLDVKGAVELAEARRRAMLKREPIEGEATREIEDEDNDGET